MEELATRTVGLQITQHTVLCFVPGRPHSALEAHSAHLIHALWGRHALSPGPVWPWHDGGGDTWEALSYSWLLVREEASMFLGPLGEHFLPLDLGGGFLRIGICLSIVFLHTVQKSPLQSGLFRLSCSFPRAPVTIKTIILWSFLFSSPWCVPCFSSSLPYKKYPQAECCGATAMLCSPPLWAGAPWPSGCVLSGLLGGDGHCGLVISDSLLPHLEADTGFWLGLLLALLTRMCGLPLWCGPPQSWGPRDTYYALTSEDTWHLFYHVLFLRCKSHA